MKIVTWNCAGAFREKYTSIIEEDADIYVIQECENPAEYDENGYPEFAGDNYCWTGDLRYKGLGIFANDNVKLEKLDKYCDTEFKNFIALRVNDSFNLLGVWAMPPYVEMIHDYFDANDDLFDGNLIMCGDFNSNVIWNKEHKTKDACGNPKDQTHLNIKLNDRGLFSVYHDFAGEKQGHETQYTFHMYRNLEKPYHIGYICAGKNAVADLKIGDTEKWIQLSDHVPLTFEVNGR